MAKCYLYAIEYTKYTKERVLSRSSLFEMEERWEYIERPAFDTQKIHKLAESEGNIPLIFRILCSNDPHTAVSLLEGYTVSISSDYKKCPLYDSGVKKLSEFISQLPDSDDRARGKQLLSLLEGKNYDHFRLECAEIFETRGKDLDKQTLDLLDELKDIDKEIEKSLFKIRLGKKDDLRELDAVYWQADINEDD